MEKMSNVLVISGVTGSGKTTLVQALHKKLTDSKIISFDDYSIDALPSAPPIDTPVEKAVNQYDISILMDHLIQVLGRYSTILIDFPFGYKHDILSPYIDKVIYVKTPLDICFARQLLRDHSESTVEEILKWAETYCSFIHPIVVDHETVVSSHIDILVDGMTTTED